MTEYGFRTELTGWKAAAVMVGLLLLTFVPWFCGAVWIVTSVL